MCNWVSGSGKISLINQILYKGLTTILNRRYMYAGDRYSIEGANNVDKIIVLIKTYGRTPRSNPATYIGLFLLFGIICKNSTC